MNEIYVIIGFEVRAQHVFIILPIVRQIVLEGSSRQLQVQYKLSGALLP
jgi:hypothetical protein